MTATRLRLSVVAVSLLLLLVQIFALTVGVPAARDGRAAFRSLYTAGCMVRARQAYNLYDFETNRRFQNDLVTRDDATELLRSPAYEALLFVPFSFLKYRVAYIAFFATNLALLGLSIWTLRPFLERLEEVWQWLPAAVFLCFFPVAAALIQGQDSIIFLILMVASAVSFYRGRDASAGVFLGLALFKVQFVIPVAVLFLLWRRWRMVAGFSATGAALAAVSWSLAGIDGLRAFTHDLPWILPSSATEGPRVGLTASAMPNLLCLFHTLAGSIVSPGKIELAAAGCSILLLAWAATRTANFALAALVSVLVSTHGMIYDAVLLVIPVAMVLDARLAVSTGMTRLWSRNIASALFVAPSACFLAGSSYCLLAALMLGLLMPLRFTSADSLP
jgi:hypothetical protein